MKAFESIAVDKLETLLKSSEQKDGIGVDIVYMPSIAKQIENKNFLTKVLTEKELELLDSLSNERRRIEFLCGRLAAKEAFMKAYRIPMSQDAWKKFEIHKGEDGSPISTQGLVSISHHNDYAIAFVVV